MHGTHTCTQPMRVCMLRLSNQQQEEEEAREHQLLCSTCIEAHEKQHEKIKQFDFLFLALFICFFSAGTGIRSAPLRLGTGLQMYRQHAGIFNFSLHFLLFSLLCSPLLSVLFSLSSSLVRAQNYYIIIFDSQYCLNCYLLTVFTPPVS